MKRLFLLILVLALPGMARSQLHVRDDIDSCIRQYPSVTVDSVRVQLLATVSSQYRTIDPDEGIKYGKQALNVANKAGWQKGIAKAYGALGQNYYAKSDNPTALDYFFKALNIYEEQKDRSRIAAMKGNIGNVYQSTRKLQKALEYDLSALNDYQEMKDSAGIARNLGNIGIIYELMEQYAMALAYYEKAVAIDIKRNDKDDIAKNMGNMSAVYSYEQNPDKNYKKAIEYGAKALKIYEERGNKNGCAINLNNIGIYYLEMARDTDAGKQAGPMVRNGYLEQSIDYLNRGIRLSDEIGFLDCELDGHKNLSDAYALQGSNTEALRHYRKYADLKDTINSAANGLKIANLESQQAETNLELTKRKLELNVANKRTERYKYISGIVLLLIITGIVGKKFVTQLHSNKLLAGEKKKHLERIKAQSNVLMDIAHTQAHEVRGVVATLLGLMQLYNHEDPADPVNKELVEGMHSVTQKLDRIITDVIRKENTVSAEDKIYTE